MRYPTYARHLVFKSTAIRPQLVENCRHHRPDRYFLSQPASTTEQHKHADRKHDPEGDDQEDLECRIRPWPLPQISLVPARNLAYLSPSTAENIVGITKGDLRKSVSMHWRNQSAETDWVPSCGPNLWPFRHCVHECSNILALQVLDTLSYKYALM